MRLLDSGGRLAVPCLREVRVDFFIVSVVR